MVSPTESRARSSRRTPTPQSTSRTAPAVRTRSAFPALPLPRLVTANNLRSPDVCVSTPSIRLRHAGYTDRRPAVALLWRWPDHRPGHEAGKALDREGQPRDGLGRKNSAWHAAPRGGRSAGGGAQRMGAVAVDQAHDHHRTGPRRSPCVSLVDGTFLDSVVVVRKYRLPDGADDEVHLGGYRVRGGRAAGGRVFRGELESGVAAARERESQRATRLEPSSALAAMA